MKYLFSNKPKFCIPYLFSLVIRKISGMQNLPSAAPEARGYPHPATGGMALRADFAYSKIRDKKAQNIIEYAILFVAVVTVLIVFLGKNGSYSTAVNSMIKQPLDMMDKARSQGFQ